MLRAAQVPLPAERDDEAICTHILDFSEKGIQHMIDLGRSIAREQLAAKDRKDREKAVASA